MKFNLLPVAASILLAAVVVWSIRPGDDPATVETVEPALRHNLSQEPLSPLPPAPTLPAAKVRLGEALFFDPRLSRDDTVACSTCHDFARGGADRLRFSLGVGQAMGEINTPTVFNTSLNFAQFWDGRAATLEEQAAGPVHNPVEMASAWPEVLAKLQADANYPRVFRELYPDGLTAANLVDAIAAYERTLLTANARFDRYLQGDQQAVSAQELAGYRLFKDYGCASCHQGVNAGGNMYQRFGILGDYFAGRTPTKADLGRFNVTGLAEDRHVFKVPGLRNVAVTAPYFHDGSVASLEEAVTLMGRYQLGRELTPDDVRAITAFLHSLTGQWQGRYLQ